MSGDTKRIIGTIMSGTRTLLTGDTCQRPFSAKGAADRTATGHEHKRPDSCSGDAGSKRAALAK